jgi:hypothetical protein
VEAVDIDRASIVGPLDDQVLAKFAQAATRAGGALREFRYDPSYLAFLKASNGGVPLKQVFNTVTVNDRVVERFLHMCDLPAGHALGAASVPVSFYLVKDRLHRRLVPFANLFGGDMLCFDYSDMRGGRPSIKVWLHDDCFEDVFFVDEVAENFDKFLKQLRPLPPVAEKLEIEPGAWRFSGTMPLARIRSSLDIDPKSIIGPLDEDLISNFESMLRESLAIRCPDMEIDPAYVSFLRACNGGKPRKARLPVATVGVVAVKEFSHMLVFHWQDERSSSSTWSLWLMNRNGIARGLLPFATCDRDRVLCFDYSHRTNKRPAIVLSARTDNTDPNLDDRGANYPVAENFDALLDMKWS